ncbi:ATP-binding protein [Chitinophaga ginsengisegetis]|uniref:hypothetical protein n=1 Tax=Chitinophaga ginsengisegetis TaxID=393003 RepID=UPI00343CD4E1
MELFKDWGVDENPFKTSPLEPNEDGTKLLIGRTDEIEMFNANLFNTPSLVTVEGPNGVGKTSLINVALYKCYENYYKWYKEEDEKNEKERKRKRLFIPCYRNFQIDPLKNIEDFIDEVLTEIAQTLLKRAKDLEDLGFEIPDDSTSIDKWLNSPMISSFQATLGPVGMGFAEAVNSSKGFEKSGFRHKIKNWLQEIFPVKPGGGVVCTIDNLEIIGTPEFTKKNIEELRDSLFNISGIRWVLCGASGIVGNIASSARLKGFLHDPIEIKGVSTHCARSIYHSRIEYCSHNDNFYIPLSEKAFIVLFDRLSHNIRNTFKYASDFCMYTYYQMSDRKWKCESEKDICFKEWFDMRAIQ